MLVWFLNECVSSGLLQKIEHGLRCNLEWPGFGKWLSMINLLLSDKYLKNHPQKRDLILSVFFAPSGQAKLLTP